MNRSKASIVPPSHVHTCKGGEVQVGMWKQLHFISAEQMNKCVCSLLRFLMSIVPILTFPACTHRLFCFPHVGGNAKSFDWAATFERLQLPSDDVSVELYSVNWRDSVSTRPSLMEVIEKLREVFLESGYVRQQGSNDQKVVFFGHSIGSIIAFELIRQFENEGIYDVIHFICSSAPSPKDLTLLNKNLDTPKRCTDTDHALYTHLHEVEGVPGGFHAEFFKNSTKTIRSDYHLLKTYLFDPSTTYLGNLDFNEGRVTCPLTTVRGAVDLTVSSTAMKKWRDNTMTMTWHNEFGDSICGNHFCYDHPLVRDSLLSLLKKICTMPALSCANHPDDHQDNTVRKREYSFIDSCPSSSITSNEIGGCKASYS